jgi:hypothetical protein
MRFAALPATAALVALALPSMTLAQAARPGGFNVDTLTALSGSWSYRSLAGASEAAFAGPGGTALTFRCNRVARVVSIARSAVPAASPTMAIWTSSMSRSVPARFDATRVLTADLAASDPLLDAIALSRGKFAVSALGAPLSAYPNWGEPLRVIEDCRS